MRVVEWLRSQSHEVMHLRDENLHRLPDGEIFQKAIAEQRVVITFDLDFSEILALSPHAIRTSVLLFRVRNTKTYHVIERLQQVLKESSQALSVGSIIVVEDSRHRVRYFDMDRPPGS